MQSCHIIPLVQEVSFMGCMWSKYLNFSHELTFLNKNNHLKMVCVHFFKNSWYVLSTSCDVTPTCLSHNAGSISPEGGYVQEGVCEFTRLPILQYYIDW